MNNQFDEIGKVICQECLKSFNMITPTHLMKSHSMTIKEYKDKYPEVEFVSKSVSAKHRNKNVKIFKEEPKENSIDNPIDLIYEVQVEDLNENNIETIPKISTELTNKVSTFIEEVKELTEEKQDIQFPNPNNSINKNKIEILNLFLKYFNIRDIKNSYYIEKINLSGHLEYRLITDICIPRLKIVFDFPKCFWHNVDVVKHSRDTILKNDGWIIIDINSIRPSAEEVKNVLKKIDLI